MINIATALADSAISHVDGNAKYFDIKFVCKDGRIKHVKKGSRNTKSAEQTTKTSTANFVNLKQNHLILIFDEIAKKPNTVAIATIIEYNGQRVHH